MNPARSSIPALLIGLFRAIFPRARGSNPYSRLAVLLLAVLLAVSPALAAGDDMASVEQVEAVASEAGEAKTTAAEAKGEADDAKDNATTALITAISAAAVAVLTVAGLVIEKYFRSKADAAVRIAEAERKFAAMSAHTDKLSDRVFALAHSAPPPVAAVVIPPVAVDTLKVQT